MAKTEIKTRMQQKHDIEANWTAASEASKPFIPLQGEIIIYDTDSTHSCQRIKIGDGVTPVGNLPFTAAPMIVEDEQEDGNIEIVYSGEVQAGGSNANGLTYSLVKNNNIIQLKASDGTSTSVTDSDTVYTLPIAGYNTLGGVKTNSDISSTTGLTPCPIIGGVPYYKEINSQFAPYTCPEFFGAVGDGVTDDYNAFVACWNDAKTNQLPIYLTQDYYLSAPMTAFPNLNVYGRGGASVTVATSFIDYTASAIHRVMIDNLNISGKTTTHPLIRLTCFWSRFNNLHLVNGSHGIYLAKHPDSSTQVENKITNCNFFYMAYGIYSDEGDVITDGMIQNCNIQSTYTGIRLGTSAGWSINSVHTYGQSEAGLDLNSCWCTMISNIYTEADNKYGINANCSWYTTITNCVLRGAKTADLFVHADGWQQNTTYKPLLSNIVAEKTSISKSSTITGCSFTS